MDVGKEREHDCMDRFLLQAKSALTSREGGNAARLPGAIAATTSLWVMQEVRPHGWGR